MSDPFKRGPRRMFPAAPDVAPLPVEPPIIELPAHVLPPTTVDVGEAWGSLSTSARVQVATVARGDQLDAIGALCRRSRHGLTDFVYRLDIINAIRTDGELVRHVEFRAVRSPSATEDELARMWSDVPAALATQPAPPPGSELLRTERNLDSRTGRLEIVRTYLAPNGTRHAITSREGT